MKADLECYNCCINKAESLLVQYNVPEEKQIEIMKEVLYYISKSNNNVTAPKLMSSALELLEKRVGITDAYYQQKKQYNKLILDQQNYIRSKVLNSGNIFLSGLKYALIGNYIDFGAMDTVEESKLKELLEQSDSVLLDYNEITNLQSELETASSLSYITDNAGEIVLDKIFIETLEMLYPKLKIKVIVRGAPVLNDATLDDAKEIGLTDIAEVIPNGTTIPGTQIELLNKSAKNAIINADLCIAKGQGNFETLFGCGYNIYYMFLCKCDLFLKKFKVKRFSAIVKNERRFVEYIQ